MTDDKKPQRNEDRPPKGHRWIFRPYITMPDGSRRYPKNAKVFKIPIPVDKNV